MAAPRICEAGAGSLPAPAAIAALGAPTEQVRFSLSEPITEFRIKLLNHFELPRDAAIEILERTWADGDCRLTIWSAREAGTWRHVDRLNWSASDAF